MTGKPRRRAGKQKVQQERHVVVRLSDGKTVRKDLRHLRPWVVCVGKERLRVSATELQSLLANIAPVVATLCHQHSAARPQIGGEEQD